MEIKLLFIGVFYLIKCIIELKKRGAINKHFCHSLKALFLPGTHKKIKIRALEPQIMIFIPKWSLLSLEKTRL